MNALALNTKDKNTLKKLASKPFNKMTSKQKDAYLKLGAKDFTRRFGKTLQQLANE